MSDLISIIVPAYNAETFIGRCIESILGQTYKQIELIVINDGSSDRTEDVCHRYVSDTRLRVKTIPNGGVSNARNTGLKMASGEWIMFVDSDDYIDLQMCEKLYNTAQKEHADMVFCNLINRFDNEKEVFLTPFRESQLVYKSNEIISLEKTLIGKESQTGDSIICLSGPVCKIINRKSIGNYLYPCDINLGEDTCFVLSVLHECRCVVYINEHLYFRDLRIESLSSFRLNYGERLVKYTNWVLAKYYFDEQYKKAAERLNIINLLRVVCLYLHKNSGINRKVAVEYIDAYYNKLEVKPSLLSVMKSNISFTSKFLLLFTKCRMYLLLQTIIRKDI